jgi:hypothetical protein
MAARVRQLFGSAYRNGAVVSNAYGHHFQCQTAALGWASRSRAYPCTRSLPAGKSSKTSTVQRFFATPDEETSTWTVPFQADKRLGLPIAAKSGPELSGRPRSLAPMLRPQFDLAFVRPDRPARFSGLLHLGAPMRIGIASLLTAFRPLAAQVTPRGTG